MIWYIDVKDKEYLWFNSNMQYGNNEPKLVDVDIIYTTSPAVVKKYGNIGARGYQVEMLALVSTSLSLKLGLYEQFNALFEGSVSNEYDMLKIIFQGVLMDNGKCSCLKVGNTYTVYTEEKTGLKLVSHFTSEDESTQIGVGRTLRQLNYLIAKNGYSIDKLDFVVWGKEELSRIQYLSIASNGRYRCLGNGTYLCKNACGGVKYLTSTIKSEYKVNSETLFNCFTNKVEIPKGYKRDYCDVDVEFDSGNDIEYGVVFDAEGLSLINAEQLCREVGCIIFKRCGNTMEIINTLYSDVFEVVATLYSVVKEVSKLQGNGSNIYLYAYGGSDSDRIKNTIERCLDSKKVLNTIKDRLYLVDVASFAVKYVKQSRTLPRNGQNTIANALGVRVHKPEHNSLNDAKTLYNIMYYILQNGGGFCGRDRAKKIY